LLPIRILASFFGRWIIDPVVVGLFVYRYVVLKLQWLRATDTLR
jgi:hypothetical protein